MVILVPLLTHGSEAKVQLTHWFWLLYTNLLYLAHTSVATAKHNCCRKPYTHKQNHPRLPGITQQRARSSKTANVWKRTSSTYGTSVQWSYNDLYCSAGNLQQVWTRWGFFRVWSWFLLMETIMPGCLECTDHCGGEDETQTPNQKQMETFIIVVFCTHRAMGV